MRVFYLLITCSFLMALNLFWMKKNKPHQPIMIHNVKKKLFYFPIYVIFLWSFLFLGGYFEKKLISIPLVNPTFIIFFTRISSFILTGIILKYKIIRPIHPAPFSIPAIMNIVATCAQMESLAFVSFPEFGASKSLRLILVGAYSSKRRFEMFLWFIVSLLCAGFVFKYRFNNEGWTYPGHWGIIWLLIFILTDSLTSITQEEIYKKFKVPSVQMMFYINFWLICIILPQILLDTDTITHTTMALQNSPWGLLDLIMLTLFSSGAQYFALCIIRNFGALAFVFTCTLKTLMTIAFIKYFKIGMWDWYEIIGLAAIIIIVCYIVLKRKPWKYRNNIPKALLADLMPLVSED